MDWGCSGKIQAGAGRSSGGSPAAGAKANFSPVGHGTQGWNSLPAHLEGWEELVQRTIQTQSPKELFWIPCLSPLPTESRKVNSIVQPPPTVANGLRHLLALIKNLTLLYSWDIRKLQQHQTTQCSYRAHWNYDANLRHSTLWVNPGLWGCQKICSTALFPFVALSPHCQGQRESLEMSFPSRCPSSKFLKALRFPASTTWCHLHSRQRESGIPHIKLSCSFRDWLAGKCQ